MNKSLLNRYVRYIYRKMMKKHGVEKTREEALKIFALTTPERARVKEEEASTLSPEFVDGILGLAKGWGIPTKFINESLATFGTVEDLDRLLLDLTPIRIRIRKLTPTECLRLMDVHDEDIEVMKQSGLQVGGQLHRLRLYGGHLRPTLPHRFRFALLVNANQ